METQFICKQILILITFCVVFTCMCHFINKLNKHDGMEYYTNITDDRQNSNGNNTSWNQLENGQKSIDCYNLPINKCINYSNCGVYLKSGQQPKCVPGDKDGPLFEEGADKWMYTDYTERHGLAQKISKVVDPWDKFYAHDYEASYPSPISIPAL